MITTPSPGYSILIWLLLSLGVKHVIGCDRSGILFKGRKENINPVKKQEVFFIVSDLNLSSLLKKENS
jgi:hypothetical protein